MTPPVLEQETADQLTEEQKRALLEAYNESLYDDGVDAFAAIEEIRAAHGL